MQTKEDIYCREAPERMLLINTFFVCVKHAVLPLSLGFWPGGPQSLSQEPANKPPQSWSGHAGTQTSMRWHLQMLPISECWTETRRSRCCDDEASPTLTSHLSWATVNSVSEMRIDSAVGPKTGQAQPIREIPGGEGCDGEVTLARRATSGSGSVSRALSSSIS